MSATIFNKFRDDFLSAFTTESSILAYSTRLRHLEPLAESRFSFNSVKDWSDNLQKNKSHCAARELIRLAKKFWEYGTLHGEFAGANPFLAIKLNSKNSEPHPRRITLERESSLCYKENYLNQTQIAEILSLSPSGETRRFWELCSHGKKQAEAYEIANSENAAAHAGRKAKSLSKFASARTRELQTLTRKLSQKWGVKITFNLLRHSYGANLLLGGAPLEEVRKKMGFANLKEVVRNYESVIVNRGINISSGKEV